MFRYNLTVDVSSANIMPNPPTFVFCAQDVVDILSIKEVADSKSRIVEEKSLEFSKNCVEIIHIHNKITQASIFKEPDIITKIFIEKSNVQNFNKRKFNVFSSNDDYS